MKIAWYKRASFWNLVIQSGQIALGAAQGITLAAEVQHVWNYMMAVAQAGLGILSLWTKDANSDGIIDVAQEVDIDIKANVPVNVKTEIKEP